MPLGLAVWRIDGDQRAVAASGLDLEESQDVAIADAGWKIIGRQIDTGLSSPVDLLAVGAFGNPAVLELKRNEAPREASSRTPTSSSAACSCRRSQGSPGVKRQTGPRHHATQKR
jgi:hypothetical protein